uniref:Uncharacterized protein n=1 Tax=Arcella intermedia TaxID=1963864 RepID=A0A6B2LA46_9EUKA
MIYATNWSTREDEPFRLALGSFCEDHANKVEIIQLNPDRSEFEKMCLFDHPYPPTKLMWVPDRYGVHSDLLGTTGDYLRIWKVKNNSNEVELKSLLNNNKNSEFCAPLTSFDWNDAKPTMVGTSSIDTTCTIWDIEKEQAVTQLIAHDKEVFDIAFARSTDVFASVGADGSVRMFDLRSLEHSTIIYETPELRPLLRLVWNKTDSNYLATFMENSSKAIILDIRVPSVPAAELSGHSACLNGVAWAPHSSPHICTAADDTQALIWDLTTMQKPVLEPILAYNAEAAINQLQWSSTHTDWIAIAYNQTLQILRV